jgi:hypothetical protein
MELNRIRFEADGKLLRVLVDREDVVARMKRVWEDVGTDSRGIVFRDLVVDKDALARSGKQADGSRGNAQSLPIFNCECGIVGCVGIDAVEVTHDGYAIHWRIRPSALEASAIEFSFDPAQYLREVSRIPREKGPTRTERIVAKRAKKKAPAARPARKAAKKSPAKKATCRKAPSKPSKKASKKAPRRRS